jgi:hypothetical protein
MFELHTFGGDPLTREWASQRAIPLALLCFNVGVELGQLIFVAAIACIAWPLRRVQWPRLQPEDPEPRLRPSPAR